MGPAALILLMLAHTPFQFGRKADVELAFGVSQGINKIQGRLRGCNLNLAPEVGLEPTTKRLILPMSEGPALPYTLTKAPPKFLVCSPTL